MEKINLKKNILIFSDLDGTLLNEKHKFSDLTIKMIEAVYKKGFYFIPITARNTFDIFQQARILNLDKLNGIASANNSAQIFDFKENKYIRSAYLSNEFIEFVFNETYGKLEKYKVHFYADDTTYVYCSGENSKYWTAVMKSEYKIINKFTDLNKPICRLSIILEKDPTRESIINFSKKFSKYLETYSVVSYSSRVYEFTPKNCFKSDAFEYILNYLNIDRADTTIFAFGDGSNDISMFLEADYAIATYNAIDEAKECANFITDTNENSGVAKFILKYIML